MEQASDRLSYMVISDLHSGALSSVLTPLTSGFDYDPKGKSATAEAFGKAISATLTAMIGDDTPPDLILLGDAVELSFSPPDRCAEVLHKFLSELYQAPDALSDQIMFLPGNHDHSLWTAERYDLRAEKGAAPGFRHVTDAFQTADACPNSRILEAIAAPLGLNLKVPTFYPNMGLTNDKGDRAVMLHHGHFIENTYRMMNVVVEILSGGTAPGGDVKTLEMLNGDWIDFGWSTIGSAGLLGKDVSLVYQNLMNGAESAKFQKRIADHLAHLIAHKFDLPPTKMIEEGLSIVARGIVESLVGTYSQLERYAFNDALSAGSVTLLRSYLNEAALPQMQDELPDGPPDRTTFIFGHTHKPFEDQVVADGFDQPVGVYNTGGWVLDTTLLSTVEGASAVFIDEDLNTTALRLFGLPVNGVATEVRVVSADVDRPGVENPLQRRLQEAVDAHQDLWDAFSQAAASDLMARQSMILKMTSDSDFDADRNGGLV